MPFAGTDDLTRSHFETQDTIELGQSINGTRDYRSGFMARLAGVLTGGRPIAFTDQMPLTFQGGDPVPNIAINNVGKPASMLAKPSLSHRCIRTSRWQLRWMKVSACAMMFIKRSPTT